MLCNILLRIPSRQDENKYLLGLDVYDEAFATLDNNRPVRFRKVIIHKALNPWGFEGETMEEIRNFLYDESREYFHEGETFDENLKIGLHGLKYQNPFIKPLHRKILTKRDILVSPIKDIYLKDDEEFIRVSDGKKISWAEFPIYSLEKENDYIQSVRPIVDNEFMELVKNPYYSIKLPEDTSPWGYHYVANDLATPDKFTITSLYAKLFDSEDNALKFALENIKPSEGYGGFEVVETKGLFMIPYIYCSSTDRKDFMSERLT